MQITSVHSDNNTLSVNREDGTQSGVLRLWLQNAYVGTGCEYTNE